MSIKLPYKVIVTFTSILKDKMVAYTFSYAPLNLFSNVYLSLLNKGLINAYRYLSFYSYSLLNALSSYPQMVVKGIYMIAEIKP